MYCTYILILPHVPCPLKKSACQKLMMNLWPHFSFSIPAIFPFHSIPLKSLHFFPISFSITCCLAIFLTLLLRATHHPFLFFLSPSPLHLDVGQTYIPRVLLEGFIHCRSCVQKLFSLHFVLRNW